MEKKGGQIRNYKLF